MGLFGLNFGLSKNKSKSESKIDKTETTNQQQSTNTQGTTSSTTSQTGSTSSTGTSTSNQATTATGTRVNDTTGKTSLFSDPILQALDKSVLDMLGAGQPQGINRTFDQAGFINSTMGAAEANSRDILDIASGQIGDMTGSKIGNSSMGTLLLDRVQRGQDANLAGIRGQATATAAGIQDSMDKVALASNSQGIDRLTQILAQLKGGQATSTQSGTEGTTSAGTGTSTTNSSESTQSKQDSTSLQTISQLVNALLTGTTNTKGTESTKGSGSGMNMGLNVGGK